MKKFTFLLVLLATTVFTHAQTGTVSGKILEDDTRNPIPYANVLIEVGTDTYGAASDFEGKFKVENVPVGKHPLSVSFVGYESYEEEVEVKNGETTILVIKLMEAQVLEEITMQAYAVEKDVEYAAYEAVEIYDAFSEVHYSNNTSLMNVASPTPYTTTTNGNGNAIQYSGHTTQGQTTFAAGQLTATEINDFSKWELWGDIADYELEYQKQTWDFVMDRRYSVQVVSDKGMPVCNARVTLISTGTTIWEALTDNTGKAELWNEISTSEAYFDDLRISVTVDDKTLTEKHPKLCNEGMNMFEFNTSCGYSNAVDIAFAVDATGSMDDEIDYLKEELGDIIEKIQAAYADLDINTGTVFYKASGEDYSTKFSQFTSDLMETVNYIKKQDAAGGGDEIVDSAFVVATNELNWREDARARLLFIVLDEPSATDATTLQNFKAYAALMAKKGIKVIPIVASGEGYDKDRNLEYLMRCMALATNGTCAFITDHSGIGNSHTEPVTDEITVEKLNDLLLRIIEQNLYVPPCEQELFIVDDVISDTTQVELPDGLAHTNNSGADSTATPINVTAATSALTASAPTFSFYPNPTNGPVTLNIDANVQDLYIADLSGKLMERLSVTDQTSLKLDLSDYPTGIYFIQCIYEDRNYSGKLVLTRY